MSIFFLQIFSYSGVPPEVVGNFDYYKPVIEFEKVPLQHPDFINKTKGTQN